MPKISETEDPVIETSLLILYVTRKNIEKPFWFSSLSQMFQFGTIKFRRTFKNLFSEFVRIEKKSHYKSRDSLHEAPTKNSKNLGKYFIG